MIRMIAHDLELAISWLSTTCFNDGPFDLLAIALDHSSQGDLTQRMNERRVARKLHRVENAVIFTLSPSHSTPQTPGSVANPEIVDWLATLNKSISNLNSSGRVCAQADKIFDTTLALLNIQKEYLPAIYLRIKGTPPIILPVEDIDQTLEFVLEIFEMAQESKMTGDSYLDLVEDTLKEYGLYATCLTEDEQEALDCGLSQKEHSKYSDRAWAVINILQESGIHQELRKRNNRYVFKYHNLVYKVEKLLADHDVRSLKTAVIAYQHGDFGTVCRNIGAIVEGSLAGSLVHIVRGNMGVSLPQYIDLQDPNVIDAVLGKIELNARQNYIGNTSNGKKVRWKAPMLNQQLTLIPLAKEKDKISIVVSEDGWQIMSDLARAIADLRNPSAHGGEITQNQADASWRYLDKWYSTGCAQALHMIRTSLDQWPSLHQNPLSDIKPGFIEEAQHIQSTLRKWSMEARQLITEGNLFFKKKDHLSKIYQGLEDIKAYKDSLNNISDLFIFNLPSSCIQQIDASDLVNILKPCTDFKKMKKKLKREIPRHIRAGGDVYRCIGLYIDDSENGSREIFNLIEFKLSTTDAEYRDLDSEAKLIKKINTYDQAVKDLMIHDGDWLRNIHQLLEIAISEYEVKIKDLEFAILEMKDKYENAVEIDRCIKNMEKSAMEREPIACTCHMAHSLF